MQNDKAPERIYALTIQPDDTDRPFIYGYSFVMGDVEYIRADLVKELLPNDANDDKKK